MFYNNGLGLMLYDIRNTLYRFVLYTVEYVYIQDLYWRITNKIL